MLARMTTLKVYGGWEAHGVADFSPACLKLKTYLKMTNVTFDVAMGDPRKAPTKTIPYVEDGDVMLGDSGLIFSYLKGKHGDPLDEKLTKAEHAMGHLIRRTVEESLYFAMLHERWSGDESWGEIEKMLLPLMPPVIGGLIAGSIRKGTLQRANAQGIGRLKKEDVLAHGKHDIDALSEILGEKPYFLGDSPTSYDASVFGGIANVMAFPKEGILAKHARGKKNLASFVDRLMKKYWTKDEEAKD
jgi:glutathione S-transferase